jgi:hypothetical protein
MPSCLRCGQPVDQLDEICTICREGENQPAPAGSENALTSDPTGISVARFESMAEAGFFADQLVRSHKIPTTLSVDETFDAISGHWATRFVLNVPDDFSQKAAVLLERLVQDHEEDFTDMTNAVDDLPDELPSDSLTEIEDDFAPAWQEGEDGEAALEHGMSWFPIMLTLAAGGAAVWGLREWNGDHRVHPPAVPERQQVHDLWDELGHDSSPWVQNSQESRAVRKLWIDESSGQAVLQEDRDGDGIFERETRLTREPSSP